MRRILIAIALMFSLFITPVVSVSAGVLDGACQSNGGAGSPSAACTGQQEQISGKNGILYRVTQLIARFAGVAAILLIVVSGILFVTANGEAGRVASARSTLIGAVVGLVIVIAAESILKFVLTKV